MAERRTVLQIDLPPYPEKGRTLDPALRKRLGWRKAVHANALAARRGRAVRYEPDTPVEVEALIYLSNTQMKWQDVDNLMKDVLDALQGRLGGEGKAPTAHKRVIDNDHSIFRLIVEKRAADTKHLAGGKLTIRPLR